MQDALREIVHGLMSSRSELWTSTSRFDNDHDVWNGYVRKLGSGSVEILRWVPEIGEASLWFRILDAEGNLRHEYMKGTFDSDSPARKKDYSDLQALFDAAARLSVDLDPIVNSMLDALSQEGARREET